MPKLILTYKVRVIMDTIPLQSEWWKHESGVGKRDAMASASYHSISAPPRRAFVVCVQTGEIVARYYNGKRMATKTMTVSEVIANG